eukprot:5235921-Amphidinium_carterae.1
MCSYIQQARALQSHATHSEAIHEPELTDVSTVRCNNVQLQHDGLNEMHLDMVQVVYALHDSLKEATRQLHGALSLQSKLPLLAGHTSFRFFNCQLHLIAQISYESHHSEIQGHFTSLVVVCFSILLSEKARKHQMALLADENSICKRYRSFWLERRPRLTSE